MDAKDIIYSSSETKNLSDKELCQLLYKSWNIKNKKIEVWGWLRAVVPPAIFWIYDVRLLVNNKYLSYPYHVERDIESGIYIDPECARGLLDGQSKIWIKCELELSHERERERQNNPFALRVKKESATRLVLMPFFDLRDIVNDDVSSYITEKIYNLHLKNVSERIAAAQLVVESELKTAKDECDRLVEQNNDLKSSSALLQSNISTQHYQYQQVEQEMTKKIEKLKSYISEKALFLKKFEFIGEDDFDNFIADDTAVRDNSDALSFSDDYESNYKQAVSHIHAYLEKQGTFYPRHIIENYLTLIRSNDLIILAGDSGSGKTNLVQSFAKAVGGESKIIPVKPNWTSSEDLLGYYNPLEKKYLATPFLEALLEAGRNPKKPYFICLDEMNLARVEYYFADFLSKLESRDSTPEIQLYSDDEAAHVLSELKAVVDIISGATKKYSQEGIVNFVKLMQDENVNAEMKRAFGFGDKDSLIKYHGDIRRMVSGTISINSKIKIPANVRIIGTVNIDETTHYLSPKILDRAHIMKFKSPLLTNWSEISSQIKNYDGLGDVSKPLHFEIEALGVRTAYPKFDYDNEFCKLFVDLNEKFFNRLGVEFGMRTIRQGLNYLALFSELNDDSNQAVNNFIIHKVLPKFTFDGSKQAGDQKKLDLMDKVLLSRFERIVPNHESLAKEFSCVAALKNIIENATANDGVVNYWA